jgi:hypothetical protein
MNRWAIAFRPNGLAALNLSELREKADRQKMPDRLPSLMHGGGALSRKPPKKEIFNRKTYKNAKKSGQVGGQACMVLDYFEILLRSRAPRRGGARDVDDRRRPMPS